MTHKPRLLLMALSPLLSLAACGGEQEKHKAPPPPTVSVARVALRSLDGGFTASGRLLPREEVAIAPELSGYRIARVLVEEDAQVRAGQVLAVLDDALLRSQIAQARAQLTQSQVAYDKARMEAVRVSGLDNQGILSQEAIDQRRIADRSAQASVGVARAQLDDLLTREQRLTIRTPVAGRVLQRSARPGEPSASGTTLFTIARDNLVELNAEVPEAAMGTLATGDPVRVMLASGAVIDGHVRLLGARVDNQTGLSTARIALPVRQDLRPGGFAQARFTRMGGPVLTAPEGAVHYDADGAYMLLLDGKDRVHRMAVRTGRRTGGMVEILSGPHQGDRAVLGGGAFVLEGDKVRIAGGKASS
ncbi:efflux RND transporter periplasmic adaptor subunit [Sphingobium sp. CAP-1]|uniref:efflux RND transporter periplasmic adaptor subunit n=1 Tax=Sphingobium sp. CAP-1 TaxID=2676077 RepID=UPI0012BB4056|nr:efflux RND transporter periplasmic adaptor subunit [Sphingobium sp. CAP-1]QGP81252.1 efflux RND transporter periplasmic adaptor subunit [Sphingobium sp. CAP-1]